MSAPDKLVAALAGRYRIDRELGRGGMATVYLAEDVRHHRNVAVKVLHPELSAVIGEERFLKEIELTAALQHPHILALFDSGNADGLLYYVMPFVEGETLRSRLDRELQLPVADAQRIASEVAGALEYAHARKVVHRDIKPENILLQSGSALVADFGIALAVQSAGGQRLTQTGLSLGTPQYMAPEQAMGERNIDHRADIYALGAVTYEMLAGEPPFTGPTAQSIIAKIMTEDASALSAKRRSVPAAVENAVMRALEKLPADRWNSAHDFAAALASTDTRPVPRGNVSHAANRTRNALPWVVAAVASIVAAFGWMKRPAPVSTQPPSRLSIMIPGGSSFPGGDRLFNMSADGTRIVYYSSSTTAGGTINMLHELDGVESVPIKGTENAGNLHLSPDGRTLYISDPAQVRMSRVSLDANVFTPLSGVPSTPFLAFAPDSTIWISTLQGALATVGRDGKMTPRFRDDTLSIPLVVQQVLDNGRELLAKETQNTDGLLHLVDLRTGARTQLLEYPVAEARFQAGYLIVVRSDGRLDAIPFDMDSRKATGDAVQLADAVSLTGTGVAQFAVSRTGTIAYLPAQPRELMLVDRSGRAVPITDAKRSFHQPRFSSDEASILVDYTTVDGRDVWKLDRASGAFTRVTSENDGHDANWSPDGRSVLYASSKGGTYGVYKTRPGTGTSELLFASNKLTWSGRWLPDGKTVLTTASEMVPNSGGDIILADSAGKMTNLVATRAEEQWPDVSPDGKWLAYTSNLSGDNEVYVRALNGGDHMQVSLSGGTEPMWSKDGRELFFRAAAGGHVSMAVATITTSPNITVTSRKNLFEIDDYDPAQPHSNYDVTKDGKHFVMVRRGPVGRIAVIQNFPALVRKLQGAPSQGR